MALLLSLCAWAPPASADELGGLEAPEVVLAPLRAAQRDGLPVGRLLAKAREGIAKRVPAPAIAGVLERMRVSMVQGRALLGSASLRGHIASVEAAGRAVQAGAPAAVVRQTVEATRRSPKTRPPAVVAQSLSVLADLQELGVSGPAAGELVAALLEREGARISAERVARAFRRLQRGRQADPNGVALDLASAVERHGGLEAAADALGAGVTAGPPGLLKKESSPGGGAPGEPKGLKGKARGHDKVDNPNKPVKPDNSK